MPLLIHKKKIPLIALLMLAGFIVLAMLYFGIRFKGFRPVNNVRWSDYGTGIEFNRYSIAFTDGFFEPSTDPSAGTGLSMEMAIEPERPQYSNFRFILVLHDGKDEDQIVIGQWRSSLVIMTGKDFSNRRRQPKLYLQLQGKDKGTCLLSIVSNSKGTNVYLNGELKQSSSNLIIAYPVRVDRARLVVGNSLSGNNPWEGKISGLSFYDKTLQTDDIERHFNIWRANQDFAVFQCEKPRLLYTFDEGKGMVVHNKTGEGFDLAVPAYMTVLQKKPLSWPQWANVTNASIIEDVTLNLIGFIPFGFIFMAIVSRFEGIGNSRGRLVVVLIAFVFSLSIEIAQVWIPSRDSSLLDLLLNTLGGYQGTLIFGSVMGKMRIPL